MSKRNFKGKIFHYKGYTYELRFHQRWFAMIYDADKKYVASIGNYRICDTFALKETAEKYIDEKRRNKKPSRT